MLGGTGDDTYVVAQTTDVTTENANEGIDTVQSSITWTLNNTIGNNIENLTLIGTSVINATGNLNVLKGNSRLHRAATPATTPSTAAPARIPWPGWAPVTRPIAWGAATVRISSRTTTSSAGNTDVAQFLAGVARDQIWLQHTGNDLVASIIGTSDKLTVQNWYLGSANHVEQFRTADGSTLLDSNVQNLVNAMAAFAPPAPGQEMLPPNYAPSCSNPAIAGPAGRQGGQPRGSR